MTKPAAGGAQTLERALAILHEVANGAEDLATLSARTGLTRSTTQRLAAALVQNDYLRKADGYRLGSKLIELGYRAREQVSLVALARPTLLALADSTRDTIHLGLPEGDEILYIEKLPGRRGLELRSRVGTRMPMAITGIGKALMLDMAEDRWRRMLEHTRTLVGGKPQPWDEYRDAMRRYAAQGVSFDLSENEYGVRCVAAPIRDASGAIVAAVSVAATENWMEDARMSALIPEVRMAAEQVSRQIGWAPSERDPADHCVSAGEK